MTSSIIKRTSLLAALLLTTPALAGAPSSASASAAACTQLKEELVKHAQEQGINLNQEQISTLASDEATIAATNIAGFENIPDTEYAKGVDVAFVYIDSPEAGVPAGHYRVNVQANPEDIKVGRYTATATLFDKDGKEVAKRATRVETFGTPLKSAAYGSPLRVGLQQQTINDWNIQRFRGTVTLIMVRPWGVLVLDLFNSYTEVFYGW
ncbi:hypothetical protein ACQKGO_30565 [Corallococcus interemptor]|uniref:hypothetical protein n=1 Tax=Corallococcus interemptor TaxID=2316720 RepID=UPI003D04BA9A